MQTKIRTTIATLAATFAVAVAVAPAAHAAANTTPGQAGTPGTVNPGSTEARNDGRFQSALAKGFLKSARCAQNESDFKFAVGEHKKAQAAGDQKAMAYWLSVLTALSAAYQAAGCG